MPEIDKKKLARAVSVLKALSHPARLMILRKLIDNECNVTNLEKCVGLSQSGVSQHLRILRLSGVIEPKRDGKEICYQIVSDDARRILSTLMDS